MEWIEIVLVEWSKDTKGEIEDELHEFILIVDEENGLLDECAKTWVEELES